jgi:hypothetical protein
MNNPIRKFFSGAYTKLPAEGSKTMGQPGKEMILGASSASPLTSHRESDMRCVAFERLRQWKWRCVALWAVTFPWPNTRDGSCSLSSRKALHSGARFHSFATPSRLPPSPTVMYTGPP